MSLGEYFEVEQFRIEYAGPNTSLYPPVEEKIISEDAHEVISIDSYGRTLRDLKHDTTIPEWLELPVKSPKDLERVIKEHFDPDRIDERWPDNWDEMKDRWKRSKDRVLYLDGGCYYWTLRSLAGVEYASLLFYDAPDLVDELFERINIICLEGIRKVLPELPVDYLGFGEDIAYKNSTLISPAMFRKYLLPRYRKATELARQHGLETTWYDSDGDVTPFMELYFEAGIDCFAPCEVAAGMDPVELRRQYGKKIKMIGGMDKREIARGKDAIKKEVSSKLPVIEEGGYIPRIDHSVSSDISLENYSYYISLLKDAYGLG